MEALVTVRVKTSPAHVETLLAADGPIAEWASPDRRDVRLELVTPEPRDHESVFAGFLCDRETERWQIWVRPTHDRNQPCSSITWQVTPHAGHRSVLVARWRLFRRSDELRARMKDALIRLKASAEKSFRPATMLCVTCGHVWDWHTLATAPEVFGSAPELDFIGELDATVFRDPAKTGQEAAVSEPACWFDAPWIKLSCICAGFNPGRIADADELCAMCGATVATRSGGLCPVCRGATNAAGD